VCKIGENFTNIQRLLKKQVVVEDMLQDIGQCQKKISRCSPETRKLQGVLSSIKTTPMGSQEFFWKCLENI
jgi:hypothetical protein